MGRLEARLLAEPSEGVTIADSTQAPVGADRSDLVAGVDGTMVGFIRKGDLGGVHRAIDVVLLDQLVVHVEVGGGARGVALGESERGGERDQAKHSGRCKGYPPSTRQQPARSYREVRSTVQV